jgi:hypothetical protein
MRRVSRATAVFCLALCSVVVAACRTRAGLVTEPLLRVRNVSGVRLDSVTVQVTGPVLLFGSFAPGQTSPYRAVGTAYRYARIQATVNGERLTLQPQDYVGETPLSAGRYTYELSVDMPARALRLNFRPD